MVHNRETPSSMMKVLELKPLMMMESVSPIEAPKMVAARMATRPTFFFRTNPVMMTLTKISKEIMARVEFKIVTSLSFFPIGHTGKRFQTNRFNSFAFLSCK